MTHIHLIGICGHPLHGKTTVQNMIERAFEAHSIDTGDFLRQKAVELFKLSWEDVSTQEGKLRVLGIDPQGNDVTVRKLLGDLGKLYEARFGRDYVTQVAIEKADAIGQAYPGTIVTLGGVRMTQGQAVQKAGGFMIEVVDPRKPRSPHDFDQYDPRFIDAHILNDGTLDNLRANVVRIVNSLVNPPMVQSASR